MLRILWLNTKVIWNLSRDNALLFFEINVIFQSIHFVQICLIAFAGGLHETCRIVLNYCFKFFIWRKPSFRTMKEVEVRWGNKVDAAIERALTGNKFFDEKKKFSLLNLIFFTKYFFWSERNLSQLEDSQLGGFILQHRKLTPWFFQQKRLRFLLAVEDFGVSTVLTVVLLLLYSSASKLVRNSTT